MTLMPLLRRQARPESYRPEQDLVLTMPSPAYSTTRKLQSGISRGPTGEVGFHAVSERRYLTHILHIGRTSIVSIP